MPVVVFKIFCKFYRKGSQITNLCSTKLKQIILKQNAFFCKIVQSCFTMWRMLSSKLNFVPIKAWHKHFSYTDCPGQYYPAELDIQPKSFSEPVNNYHKQLRSINLVFTTFESVQQAITGKYSKSQKVRSHFKIVRQNQQGSFSFINLCIKVKAMGIWEL